MNMFKKIVLWNKERGLIEKGFNHEKEISFIIEELLESTGAYDSISAREVAEAMSAKIISSKREVSHEVIVDAFADIIVFATGAIAKLGYDPNIVMDEVYKEINSRKGKLIDGKFIKDLKIIPYKANFKIAKTTQNIHG